MSSTALVTQQQKAKQDLNQMSMIQGGAITQKQVIVFFIYISHFIAFLSIIASAYGFYFDMLDLVDDAITTLIFSLTISAVLEALRYFLIKGVFAFDNIIVKILMIVSIALLSYGLISLHKKGLTNMQYKKDSIVLSQVVSQNQDLQKIALENISKTLAVSAETAKQFNNGTRYDDNSASRTIKSNSDLAKKLLESSSTTYAQKQLILTETKRNEARGKALLPLFTLLEVLVPLSFIAALLVELVTSSSVKDTRNVMDEIMQTEANINQNIQTLLMQKTKNSADDVMSILEYFQQNNGNGMSKDLFMQFLNKNDINYQDQQNSNSPTPPQPTKQQLEGHYNPFKGSKSEEKETDDELNSYDGTTSDAERREEFEVECDEIDVEELVELPKVIDSKLFSADEEKLIQAMWANGTRRVGHTYTKRDVERYFTDSELYSPVQIKTLMYIYTPLNVKLTGQGFVKLINGYGYEVLVEMSSVHKV